MGLIIVEGGQYGSEGKGKIAEYLAKKMHASAVIRVGGTNSGHTIWVDGTAAKLRMLPTAALTTDCKIIFPAGSYIDVDILNKELTEYNIDLGRLHIDNNAIIMKDIDAVQERRDGLEHKIASTLSGTGAAVTRRVSRINEKCIARHNSRVAQYVCDTKHLLRHLLRIDNSVIVEGTQGYELSLLHTSHYPYCTARDTSAAGILSEVGASIRDVDKVCMVLRTFPIRVGGNSGPLPFECTWTEVSHGAGYSCSIQEHTTVTGRLRRVARFDYYSTRRAINYERPDWIAMNHLDYIDYSIHNKNELSPKALEFIETFESECGHKVDICGTGERTTFDNTVYTETLAAL